jgi:hypothetical protein
MARDCHQPPHARVDLRQTCSKFNIPALHQPVVRSTSNLEPIPELAPGWNRMAIIFRRIKPRLNGIQLIKYQLLQAD